MDQAEPEDQDVSGYFGQRGAHSALDCLVRVSAGSVPQFQGQVGLFFAADTALAAA